MTERYEVHNMIKGMNIGDTMDLEVCKSLIEKYGSSRDIELFITDNGIDMTYGEVADQLNRYYKREEILKQSDNVNDLTLLVLDLQEKLKELKDENEELKQCLNEVKKDEKQLGIDFMGFKMKLIEQLQIHYDYASEQRQKNLDNPLLAKSYDIIRYDVRKLAEEMGVDLE